jgi:hypothetical protein
MRFALSRTLTTPCLVATLLLSATALAGCDKKDETKPAAEGKKDFFGKTAKPEYHSEAVQGLDLPANQDVQESPPVDTGAWAVRMKTYVKDTSTDLAQCRNEYLIPFQFQKMQRRDVMFVDLGAMDGICSEGDRAAGKRGAKRTLDGLLKEHAGKHPLLDRWLLHSVEHVEHYGAFSFMTKKIGAPDVDVVVEIAKLAHGRILELGAEMNKLAAEVDKWPDGQPAEDDPAELARALDLAGMRNHFAQSYGPLLTDMPGIWQRNVGKRLKDSYDVPRFSALRGLAAVLAKRVQQDRGRLALVTGADPKQVAELTAFLDQIDAVAKAIPAAMGPYEKRGDDGYPEKDAGSKLLAKAAEAPTKTLAGWAKAAAQ